MIRLKKRKKEKKRVKKKNLKSFFLIFPFWTLQTLISDFKFGFYVKFPTQDRLESSKIRNLDPNMWGRPINCPDSREKFFGIRPGFLALDQDFWH